MTEKSLSEAEHTPVPVPASAQPVAGTNSLAIVAFVFAILGFFSAGIAFLVGIVTGHIALSQIKKRHEGGRGLAMAALIIGYVMIGLSLLVLIIVLVVFGAAFFAILEGILSGQIDPSQLTVPM